MIKQIYMRAIVFIPALTVLLASCVKEVTNIKLPPSTPKLVVGCFISTQDSRITLTLTRSKPVFGPGQSPFNGDPAVPDASAIISNGTSSHSIPFNNQTRLYELPASQFPILPGQTYSLMVSTPKGESVSATCTVPASNLTSLAVDFTDTVSDHKKLVVRWKDTPNQTNYYRVSGEIEFINNIFNTSDTSRVPLYGRNTVFSDYEKDGQELSSKLEGTPGFGNSTQSELKVIGYDIYLLNIDKEYYNYQDSFEHYNFSNDPFSEPSPLYTNIKGGLGVFAAYQKFEMRFP